MAGTIELEAGKPFVGANRETTSNIEEAGAEDVAEVVVDIMVMTTLIVKITMMMTARAMTMTMTTVMTMTMTMKGMKAMRAGSERISPERDRCPDIPNIVNVPRMA